MYFYYFLIVLIHPRLQGGAFSAPAGKNPKYGSLQSGVRLLSLYKSLCFIYNALADLGEWF
jgi:hypothetical protein